MKRPEMSDVPSRNIHSMGHNEHGLFVRFHTKDGPGPVYHYPGVDQAAFEALKSAPSVGSHFHANIRGAFSGGRIDG